MKGKKKSRRIIRRRNKSVGGCLEMKKKYEGEYKNCRRRSNIYIYIYMKLKLKKTN